MTGSEPNYRNSRLFRGASGQDELFETPYEEERENLRGELVECLGLAFENEETRRSHFLGRLREGLEELQAKLSGVPYRGVDDAVARMAAIEHWPMGGEAQLRRLAERMRRADSSKDLLQRWKDEVGFPHGEIEDILELSDPPWHTACPNPFLGAFVRAYGKPYDPDEPYRRKPFAIDVSEGKTHAVYRAHGYHTKVPHLAIAPSILHYTEPGDLVLDGFAGSGMTGVAAQWCGIAPTSYRKSLEGLWANEGLGKPSWGLRRTIQNDLSPVRRLYCCQLQPAVRYRRLCRGRPRTTRRRRGGAWLDVRDFAHRRQRPRAGSTIPSGARCLAARNARGRSYSLEEALDDRASGRVTRHVSLSPTATAELTKRRMERVYTIRDFDRSYQCHVSGYTSGFETRA